MSYDHSGHRQRLKRALRENGLMSFSPHEVIELMLYTALPRRDVNELAHRIDDELGGVSGLLNASLQRMTEIGLSEHTAGVLKAYADCVKAYRRGFTQEKSAYILTRGELDALLKRLYRKDKRMLALLSTGQEVIYTTAIKGDETVRFIAEKALIYDAAGAIAVTDEKLAFTQQEKDEITGALSLIDVSFQAFEAH